MVKYFLKKRGVLNRSFLIHVVFVLLICLSLYFIITSSKSAASITGHSIITDRPGYETTDPEIKLQNALLSSAIFDEITQSSICVAINEEVKPIILKAKKTSSGWDVDQSSIPCSENADDLIVHFADYDSFLDIADNPSPRNIANSAINQKFEIVPSRYVELGGNVICDTAFKIKYCEPLKTMSTPEQLIDGDLACCLDELTNSQKNLLKDHLQDENFKDEIGVLEQARGPIINVFTSIIFLVVLVIIIGAVAMVVIMKKGKSSKSLDSEKESLAVPSSDALSQPSTNINIPPSGAQVPKFSPPQKKPNLTQLQTYVSQVLSQGYSSGDVKAHLLDLGWDSATVDSVLFVKTFK